MSSAEPTHIYYDLEVANQALNDTGLPPSRLSFTQVRSSSILDNPNDYFMSIVRFSLDTAGALPSFIPQIDLQQSNDPSSNFFTPDFPNKTVYEITLAYKDASGVTFSSTKPVIYIPHIKAGLNLPGFVAPASPPLTIADGTTNYYWVQNLNQWIQMINKTMSDAWASVVFDASGSVTPLTGDNAIPPYLLWNNELNIATLYAQVALFNQGAFWNPYSTPASPASANLWFNAPLRVLFSSFEYTFQGYAPPNSFLLRVYDRGDNVRPKGTAPPSLAGFLEPRFDAFEMVQAFSTGPTMCPITSIIFTTSLLPVLPSLLGIPQLFSGNSGVINQDNNNIINTVTDLEVNLTRGDEYLPNVIYEPTAEYRLLDLQSNAPLTSIQISVVWKDIFGQVHDFYIQNGCGATLKVMFRKKTFNNIVPFSVMS
jgi:hypothetical protein